MFDKKNIKNIYELTSLQEGMLFHSLYDQDSLAYFEQTHYHISGKLDVAVFKATWQEIVKRHDILRTLFVHKNVAQPLQIVLKDRPLPFHFENISHLSEEQQINHCNQHVQQDKQHRFDLTTDPLMRIAVFQLAETSFDIIWTLHHILIDGWSLNIIQDEFFLIYKQLSEKKLLTLPTPTPFSHYVKWLKQQDKEAAKCYWQRYLKGYEKLTSLPQQSTAGSTFSAKTSSFNLSKQQTTTLQQLATNNHVTINTVVQAIWGIILAQYNDCLDVVFATTVSGRPSEIKGIEQIVGLFINAIPVRIDMRETLTFTALLQKIQQEATESKKYHYYSLADIQAETTLKQTLFDHILVFENYRETQEQSMSTEFIIDKSEHFDHTNYDLTVQIIPVPEALGFHIIYNQTIYDTTLIENLTNYIKQLSDKLEQDFAIQSLELFTIAEKERYFPQKSKNNLLSIVITATFTCEPIESYLLWWAEQFDLNLQIQFAPYNQVFQQLLDPKSLLNNNSGINCIFIRFEDWLRDLQSQSESVITTHLDKNYTDLISTFTSQTGKMNFIGIFPISIHLGLSTTLQIHIRQLTQQWREFALQNSHLLDFNALPFLHNMTEIFDPQTDKLGHIPFVDEYYAAMGNYVVRQIYAWQKPHFKVIAVDCDNTLWQGICGEDGYLNVQITEDYLALQRFLLQKVEAGFLLVLCSKNNEDDVWEVFSKNPAMLLKREHIVTYRINWQAKSQNLREMAKELNLDINSFVFIDDSVVECTEVMSECPEVLTLQLPANSASFIAYLQQVWALDKFKITEEDRQRSQMYLAEKQRQQQTAPSLTQLTHFLQNLNIQVDMMRLQPFQLERVSQLTQRTNQFNLSTIRRSEIEITQLLNNPNYNCWAIDVKDKFGSYGLVGVVITEIRKNTLFLDTLLLSCRVLGRQVENAILTGLKNYCKQYDLDEIIAEYRVTAKNQPILAFLQTWQVGENTSQGILYRIACAEIPTLADYIQLNYDVTPALQQIESLPKIAGEANIKVNFNQNTAHISREWTVILANENNLLHKIHYLPLQYHQAEQLLTLSKSQPIDEIEKVAYQPPENTHQQRMLTIWQSVLEQVSIGIHDNFLALGGHSLKATRIAARIYKEFNVEISLRDIFDYPTIKQLSDIIAQRTTKEYAKITPAALQPHYPLSYAQKRLWILHQMEENSIAYNNFAAYHFNGRLDIDCLQQAFMKVIQRHEALRTHFIVIANEPRQVIHEQMEFKITVVELNQQEDHEKLIQYHAEQEANTAFNLAETPLIRVKLLKIAENYHIFLLNIHHIVSDGWSINILENEVLHYYLTYSLKTENLLPALTIQYKDYTIWQNQLLAGKLAIQQQRYWQQKLAGELPILNFPTDYLRPSVQTFAGQTVYTNIAKDKTNSLKTLAHQTDATLFMAVVAVIKIMLLHYTEQSDLIVGSPVAGRYHPELENQIGFYVNTLALRDTLNPQASFIQILNQIKSTVTEAYDNQLYPFDRLVAELDLQRDVSRSPLFDVMVILQETQPPSAMQRQLNIEIKPLTVDANISRFDLTFNFIELLSGELEMAITYNTHLFKLATIERLSNQLGILIENLLAQPDYPVIQQQLISTIEQQQILKIFNTETTILPTQTIHELFEIQVAKTPYNIAVLAKDSLTYLQLNEKANQVAYFLKNMQKIKHQEIVGVMVERSAWLIINLLGILKAGGVYLPIDPNYPQQRIDYIIENSGCRLVLTRETVFSNTESNIVDFSFNNNELAYIIYTSGSTGQPKGVMIEHISFVNMILQQIQSFKVDKTDKVLQFASPSFDASLSEIFMALLSGATLVPVAQEIIQDNNRFLKFLQEMSISVATLPPIYLNTLDKQVVKNLKTLITAGEAANPEDALFYANYLNYFNAYGPTETAVCATYYQVISPQTDNFNFLAEKNYLSKIPIGKPLTNLTMYLVNPAMKLVPIGVIGEICIAGIGLARGYLQHPDLTMEKFIDNPFKAGEKLYKTGDLGKWLADGNIEFCGRKDEQVKLRGYRIELSEISQYLLQHPEIIEVVTCITENVLVSYFVAKNPLTIQELKFYLGQFLPEYMIPSILMPLDKLPLTAHGKIDKKALPAPKSSSTIDFVMPRNEREQKMVVIWQAILKPQKELSVHDNFFDLGGDSIRAIQMVAQLRQQRFIVETKDIFLHPTIAQLAAVITQDTHEIMATQDIVSGIVPLTAIQQWFFQEYPIDKHYFNHSELFFNATRFDETALYAVFNKIQMHHDALRMTYRFNAVTREIIQENQGINYPFSFITVESATTGLDALEKQIKIAQASLDLATGPLMKAVLFKQVDGDYLLIIIHHLVIDGISWRILLQDISMGYWQYLSKKFINLPSKTCSFKLWAEKIVEYSKSETLLREIPYWQMVEATPVKSLIPDFQLVDKTVKNCADVSFSLSKTETTILLTKIPKYYRVNINTVLLTALAYTLQRWHGEENSLIMMESHGRQAILPELDMSRTVGWFTSTYPLILHISIEQDIISQLNQIDSIINQVPTEGGINYGILKYITPLAYKPNLCFQLQPQISFNYLGQYDEEDEQSNGFNIVGNSSNYSVSEQARLLYDLSFNAIVVRGQFTVVLAYPQQSYQLDTIDSIVLNFKNKLIDIINNTH